MAGGDAGDLHYTDAAFKLSAEAGVIVVLHWLKGVAHRGLAMADNRAEWYGAFSDRGCKSAAADLLNIPTEELDQVRDVAADVCERAGARGTLVPPADRALWVARVVAPVTGVDVQNATQRA